MTHVMIDLETLGVKPGCPILSIGAVQFGRDGFGETFHRIINLASCHDAGLVTEVETWRWWQRQTDEAREVLRIAETGNATSLGEVLADFGGFLDRVNSLTTTANRPVKVWGNGADFDLPILNAAYRACGFGRPPWHPYAGRCYRTLKNLRPEIVAGDFDGVKHNALADAKHQARHAIELLRALGVPEFQPEIPVYPTVAEG